jgi:hypothetical protein
MWVAPDAVDDKHMNALSNPNGKFYLLKAQLVAESPLSKPRGNHHHEQIRAH